MKDIYTKVELLQEIMMQAEKWLVSSNGKFESNKNVAKLAVAEYIANLEGYTFFN